jgi:hypothetical protein
MPSDVLFVKIDIRHRNMESAENGTTFRRHASMATGKAGNMTIRDTGRPVWRGSHGPVAAVE